MARRDRSTLSGSTGDGHTGREAVAAVWRIESARIVGALARYTGDFALAEDLAQEALAEALVSWPRDGIPHNPAGWLLTVGRRRAIDAFRRRSALDERYQALAHDLGEGGAASGSAPADAARDAGEVLWDPDQIDDDMLALMFISCHPVLSREARVALTLRVVGGLTSDEIAKVFLVPTATVQARITRAKKTLGAARVPFEVPPAGERSERLGSVLSVIYLIFTEGSSASSGDDLIRLDLASEAQRLARVLSRLMPDEPEVHGLLALLELTAARFPARTGPDGEPVLLEDQDRRRWDQAAIRRGRAALARAEEVGRGLGAYGLQAAIAECHAVAPSVDATDWGRIVLVYEALGRLAPSPVVDLNRAVAVSMAQGPAAALPIVDELVVAGELANSHLLPSVRGELLIRLGRTDEARTELEAAVRLCGNERERTVLERKLAGLP
ncbi:MULTISPECIES: RNA polymerase sigma factor [unclassified Rhodococcus (in: high G+C Gram-positive bacteria)]|uniref:RNA polymerase sigma factor n=1 Tax=unclassified Rhodococcus (in: high G+C Gram-positive bacteria) TaxID=192944 RepID=UPI00163A9ACC|nr:MULTISPECIES: sigma-70 family RNA polymerase sigma factor [unclassified Rhodococcus (in: high G+C Gram-positive bacteria)]MBC2641195.1 sigma-70 family RNA polymerase sigma factor [Rhodococcus sp. 3A]MBC2894059.1 sigma-70 family RNA polymerase sigma factor [Rhodococcus sp. 4CII]